MRRERERERERGKNVDICYDLLSVLFRKAGRRGIANKKDKILLFRVIASKEYCGNE